MNMAAIRLLDCTLRDGGYYTKWDFPRALVSRYLAAVGAAGVDVVELGMRSFPKREFLGPYAYTSDEYLESLNIPQRLVVGVMVDATTLLRHDRGVAAGVASLFRRAEASSVALVRIAAHFGDVERCEGMLSELKALGYEIGFNLMQSGGRPDAELADKAALLSKWGTVDVLYFADSLGSMDADEVTRVHRALTSAWSGPVGFHAHNNKGLALQNTLTAADHGVGWLDATITGMGRGAGNAATELLTLELARMGHDYHSDELWELVMDDFVPLQRRHGWGANVLYHYAADNAIHPTYVQTLLGDPRYSSSHVRRAIEAIARVPSTSYKPELVGRALETPADGGQVEGTWCAKDWCSTREALILGAGGSVHDHRQAIEQFVERRHVAALSLNLNRDFDPSLVSYYVAVDSVRMSLESVEYARLNRPFIIPVNRAPLAVRRNLDVIQHFDYGCAIVPDQFVAGERGCVIPAPLSIAYAIALCIVGGAKRVWLAGFDGYAAGDARQEEMTGVVERIRAQYPSVEMIALTPTTYPIEQGSVYAPY